jgi:hypothetical protein
VSSPSRSVARRSILLAVLLLGVLVSLFLGTLLVVTPVTRGFDADTYVRVQQPMTRHVTPIASGVGLLAGFASATAAWRLRRAGLSARWPMIAVACVLVLGVSSLLVNVPINTEVQSWSPHRPPSRWAAVRDRWDVFHVVRTTLAVIALACMVPMARSVSSRFDRAD